MRVLPQKPCPTPCVPPMLVPLSTTTQSPGLSGFDERWTQTNSKRNPGPEETSPLLIASLRAAKLPTLQMLSEIERTEVVPGELIRFKNTQDEVEGVYMLPVEGDQHSSICSSFPSLLPSHVIRCGSLLASHASARGPT